MSKDIEPTNTELNLSCNVSPYKALEIDYERYQKFLENTDLTEQQKQEFIDTLWNFIVGCIGLGIKVYPMGEACEQIARNTSISRQESNDEVSSKDNLNVLFENANNGSNDPLAEGSQK